MRELIDADHPRDVSAIAASFWKGGRPALERAWLDSATKVASSLAAVPTAVDAAVVAGAEEAGPTLAAVTTTTVTSALAAARRKRDERGVFMPEMDRHPASIP
ncbi:MAG TPA: hypothetical protein VM347_40460 [Nonomuraea sp.]|nr:hypothetical protein [Nonomuraea sp.]